jgi:diamine N-acetyltransferase
MQLRALAKKDIPGMLEWMHDSRINQYFRFDAAAMDENAAARFIEAVHAGDKENLHLACVDENDVYLGTVSLKNINAKHLTAEYAVSFRFIAHGTGAARYATQEILRVAFTEKGLYKIYLDVLEENGHACRFYEKQGFQKEGLLRRHISIDGKRRNLCLYGILKNEWVRRANFSQKNSR